ncbi:MAG: uroporphyrinogen methyltransferase / synthase [Clostridia bacterium]|nr:uroporphyrinogen methyltransferase / synthase [Clostridia bacterium]
MPVRNKGKVYLVGAGPGDYKLITLKGKECIEKAQVIIYDRLVNTRLLKYASHDAEIIYAGKSPERHTLKQHEINDVIVKKALEGKIVTRLKGGDPFVFGRGGEEAIALKEKGIPFEIVPGITSAISVPAYAGIPVTHRGITSNVGFVTGNEDPTKEDSSIQWDKIATGMGTLVFLMGMGNLTRIVDKLVENGRSPKTPIALIRWGTLPEQETLVGTLEDIVQKAQKEQFKNPAIIIVGEVVNLRKEIQWVENKPLFGKRVLVTRSRAQASVFAEKIEALGGSAYEFPTIEILPPEDYTPLDNAISHLDKFKWIVFTSVNGVNFFFQRLKYHGKDVRSLGNARLVAIGPKTKEELERYGLNIDFVPEEYRAEAIIEGLEAKNLTGEKILLPRADIARKVLPEKLKELGAHVEEVAAYRTVCATSNKEEVVNMLQEGKIDVITFTSSSTVKNFISLLEGHDLAGLLKNIKLASIGPITTQTAQKNGLNIDIEAKEYTLDGLLQSIVEFYK